MKNPFKTENLYQVELTKTYISEYYKEIKQIRINNVITNTY